MSWDSQDVIQTNVPLIGAAEAIEDYRTVFQSREASVLGRREVLSGKAKFGIFGDGKELPQIAMAKVFQAGDIRSGYYRDQTFALATGIVTIEQFFAQLYANSDPEADPHSAGRQMNAHFASRNLDEFGQWKDLTAINNTSPDASPTASQMPRLVGLAQASKLYRHFPELKTFSQFSNHGNEVAFGTIGNASCAEGHFWESLNALGVIQAPVIISIWDDEYGISVPNEYQITKDSLSDMLAGFQRTEKDRGYELFTVQAWKYEELIRVYQQASKLTREEHVPVVIHVTDVTQPQGHSTSGSHERYKSQERLQWEREFDCLLKMREYLLEVGHTTEEELAAIEKEDRKMIRKTMRSAWDHFQKPIQSLRDEFIQLIKQLLSQTAQQAAIQAKVQPLLKEAYLSRGELLRAAHEVQLICRVETSEPLRQLKQWRDRNIAAGQKAYGRFLYSESAQSPLKITEVAPRFDTEEEVPGYEILNRYFDQLLERDPRVIAFGEDVGKLGDVNQGFAGLQQKYGKARVMDTGIREATIMGQAIGLALRGLRPIAEIQYLDYLIYGLQTLSDDLASLHYRSHGGQKAPAIIRTRGHRLEGIWHSGSPLGMLIHALRGVHIAVPRDMIRAVGFYHTFMEGDDPAVVIEVLNAYRLKEPLPSNLHDIRLPLGVPETIRSGTDVSVVTYGVCCRLAMEAAEQLASVGIELEVIDVQTLLPFDRHARIVESIQKTNRVLFLDEDVPGGATAYMMQQVLEVQKGFFHLDSPPKTLCATAHRPPFGDDGNYWAKPQVEDIFRTVYEMMNEADPQAYPIFY
jgi:pyruvate/2-oxoglutarate/acetoin dehydrogenase E1 component/TPP-dependent pyruvate/acetoin dehydrogenase alpha subunit